MTEIALEVKNLEELSIIASALQREKKLLEWEIQKSEAKLEAFEKKYAMPTVQFMEKYSKGEMGDEEEIMTWAGEYQFFEKFKEKQKQLEDLIQECKKHMKP
jgi:hypothetical protein